ncbi:glycosyltransferase family 2 protein [Patescibacteria group bacterium]|nr:glycosyltransferase family 2 protein [Patescibacteria group bacterium]MCL5798007.1 glycosyltransferase family 2 protein [Patescibacteria group bacterium]
MNKKISIVIPNYNGRNLFMKNLPEVLKAARGAEIIVVDDASEDDSVAMLRKNFPHINVLQSETNRGFSTAVNKGVMAAKGELVLLLNSDVYPETDFLEYLLPHFVDNKVFAVGCLQKSEEEKNRTVQRGRGIGEFKNGFLIHSKGKPDKKNTLWVSGGAGIFRKDLWNDLGGLREIYDPFYWEDIDLSYRALKAGYKVAFEPKSTVWHKQSTGAIRNKYDSSRIKAISYRNQILFVWMNITDFGLLINHLLYLVYITSKSIIKIDKSFISGLLQAIVRLPQAMVERFKFKSMIKIKDEQIFLLFKKD